MSVPQAEPPREPEDETDERVLDDPADTWPEVDPRALQDKSFMVAGDVPGGEVAVTASNGPIQSHGAPSRIFSDLAELVGTALKRVGNMASDPLVVHAHAYASMTIVFGEEPVASRGQMAMRFPATWASGRRVADLVELEDQQLAARSSQLGAAAPSYAELARFVANEGIDLDVEPLGDRPRRLTAERAAQQYRFLSRPPERRERDMEIEGLLYRVIYARPGAGRVGIRLAPGSPVPPRKQGRIVIVDYKDPKVEDAVLHRLVGRPVIAHLRVFDYAPQTNLLNELPPHPLLTRIEEGRRYEAMDFLEDLDEYVDS